MLILTQSQVRSALGMPEAIDIVERACIEYSAGRADIPLRTSVTVPDQSGVCLFMPGYLPGLGSLGQKIVALFPGNPGKELPVLSGLFILLDAETGLPAAVMDALYLTALRTGALTGVACRHLARHDARRAALLGTGGQAFGQLSGVVQSLDLEEMVVWGRHIERAEALVKEGEQQGWQVRLGVAATAEEAVRGADMVVTVTSSREPIIQSGWLKSGALICGIGSHSPTAREIDEETVARADKIVADSLTGVLNEAGDILIPLEHGRISREQVLELGRVAGGQHPGRERDDELIVFKSCGFAALDLATGLEVARRAQRQGLGTEIDILS